MVVDGRTVGDGQRYTIHTGTSGALTMRFDVWQLRQDCVGRFRRFPALGQHTQGEGRRKADSLR